MSNAEITQYANEYEAATNYFLDAVKKLNPADLDKPKSDGWNARQVIHHLADSESQSCARLKRLVAEPGTTISLVTIASIPYSLFCILGIRKLFLILKS